MTVTLLDLRRRDPEPPARLEGRLVVLDAADSLLKHIEIYQDLIGRRTVSGLICVAVGDAGPEASVDGVALTLPPALRPDGERRSAVLWAGHPAGMWWAPQSALRFAEPGAPDLDSLVAVLQVTEVFDAVLSTSADMPGAVASPGLRLAQGPVATAAVGDAAAEAASSLCRPSDDVSRTLATAVRQLGSEHDPSGPVLAPPIAARAREAQRTMARTGAAVRALGQGWRLLGPERPTAVAGPGLRACAQATGAYRAELDRLLSDMDGHLEEGRPPMHDVLALGVAEPRPADGTKIMDGLRRLVDERFAHGVTLPVLAGELRAASAFSAPQGVSALHDRVRRVSVPDDDLPRFPRRPLSLWTLPLIALTCLVTVLLAGSGPDGLPLGLLLASVWTVAGWLLLARRPTPGGEQGFGASAPAALATYGGAALVGVAAGYLLHQYRTDLPEMPSAAVSFGALGGFVVLALAVAAWSWRAAARRWSARLPLADLGAAITTLDESTATACVAEWQPMHRRRAASAAARVAAGGVEALRQVLDEDQPGDQAGAAAPAPPELVQVIRADLVDLCRTALGPVWSAGGAPHGSADAEVRHGFRRLLDDYREHLDRNGPASPFNPDADPGPRDTLMTRSWTGSSAAKDALLCRAGDQMTQLCDEDQLEFLSSAAPPGFIRFAPQRLLHVLRHEPTEQRVADDPHIAWTRGSEFVGAVRLMALRPESIRWGWNGGVL